MKLPTKQATLFSLSPFGDRGSCSAGADRCAGAAAADLCGERLRRDQRDAGGDGF